MIVHATRPGATRAFPDSRQASRTINPAAIYASRAEQAAAANARGPQKGGDDAPGAARSLPDPNAIYGARRGEKGDRR